LYGTTSTTFDAITNSAGEPDRFIGVLANDVVVNTTGVTRFEAYLPYGIPSVTDAYIEFYASSLLGQDSFFVPITAYKYFGIAGSSINIILPAANSTWNATTELTIDWETSAGINNDTMYSAYLLPFGPYWLPPQNQTYSLDLTFNLTDAAKPVQYTIPSVLPSGNLYILALVDTSIFSFNEETSVGPVSNFAIFASNIFYINGRKFRKETISFS